MTQKIIAVGQTVKDFILAFLPTLLVIIVLIFIGYRYMDPAPPKHFVISTGDDGGDFQTYAKLYRDIIKDEGIDLEVRSSKGAWENLRKLKDANSDVEVGFIEDGLGNSDEAPDVSSLGSLYYEPLWVFYHGPTKLTRFSQLKGKKIGIGEKGGGTHTMAKKLLTASGIDDKNASFVETPPEAQAQVLKSGNLDIAFFMATPTDSLIQDLFKDRNLHLMSVDQAEAIAHKVPYLHHVVLPHGAIDLKENIPSENTDLVASTVTLVVKDSLHPALIYLLLKAASQIHGEPGLFENKDEFPINRDYAFPLTDEAKAFYKSGLPFWQRYLPFWLAILVERFILLVIPALALILPVIRMIPRIMQWRVKSRIYSRYGELKLLETQIKPDSLKQTYTDFLNQLDSIEERVNEMKIPLDFSDYVYHLKEHIHFVRTKLERLVKSK